MRTFGEEMRSRLQRLHIGIRRVDDLSREDAHTKHNGSLHISKYRLRELQRNPDDITVAEVAELAKLCQTTFKNMLGRYLSCYPELLGDADLPPSTQLLPEQASEWLESLPAPGNSTSILPSAHRSLNAASSPLWSSGSQYIYGRIGLSDRTMWPLLLPGSVVRVNTRQKIVARHGSWHNDYDRPIYFLEIRDGFACGWCDLYDRQLILTPHSLSPASPRSFVLGREVEVRGRVMGYAVDCESANGNGGSWAHVGQAGLTSRAEVGPAPSVTARQRKGNSDPKKDEAEDNKSGDRGTSADVTWFRESA
jgi:hypothetical protein